MLSLTIKYLTISPKLNEIEYQIQYKTKTHNLIKIISMII